MSYRRSNYRKLRKVFKQYTDDPTTVTRAQRGRVTEWAGRSFSLEPRPEGWGVPKRKRAA